MGAKCSTMHVDRMVCQVVCDLGDLPFKASQGAAGSDLRAKLPCDVVLQPSAIYLVSTGVQLAIPSGFEGQIRSRSGLAKQGVVVVNSPGTIDSDYRGVVMVLLINHGNKDFTIKNGDRIAQLVFARCVDTTFSFGSFLEPTVRNTNGLGSTGMV